MKQKSFISIYDNALSPEECKFLIDYFESDDETLSKKQRGMTLGGEVVKDWKDSYDRYMDWYIDDVYQQHPVHDIVANRINECCEKYKKENPELEEMPKWVVRDGFNMQKYEPGGGYHILHCENYNVGRHSNNILAWMFYLNTVKEGGGTRFENFDLNVNAVQGRCVIWPAYWTHMHKGITSKTFQKYIITGWFCIHDVKSMYFNKENELVEDKS